MKKRKTPRGDGKSILVSGTNISVELCSMKKRKTPRGDGKTGSSGSEGSSGSIGCMWSPKRGR